MGAAVAQSPPDEGGGFYIGSFADLCDLATKGEIWTWGDEFEKACRGDFGFAEGGEIANVEEIDGDASPLPLRQIRSQFSKRFAGFPASCGGRLFVPNGRGGIDWLDNPNKLFGWLANFGSVRWVEQKTGCIKRSEFFEELIRGAERRFDAIELTPHEPRVDGHFYACEFPESGNGAFLDRLIDRFCPDSPADRQFIKAAFVTPFWGGPFGYRPLFEITADAGRESGKSTLVELIGKLAGGYLAFDSEEKGVEIRKRIVDSHAAHIRVCVIDNVKSSHYSSPVVESLITSEVINARPVHGAHNVFRPNNITWMMTMNGVSLSTDLAKRMVTIKLRKPQQMAGWIEETRQFVDDHRQEIIGDILAFLREEGRPLHQHTRFPSWDKAVLSKLDDADDLAILIRQRQTESDVGTDESEILEHFILQRLTELDYTPRIDKVFIPSQQIHQWYGQATNDLKPKVAGVSRKIKQMIREKTITRLEESNCNAFGRGFVWCWDGRGSIDYELTKRIQERDREAEIAMEREKEDARQEARNRSRSDWG